jgi:hypothetical protein
MINDRKVVHNITGQLESMALKNDKIEGGSGYAAATVQDLGHEITKGAGMSAGRENGRGISGGEKIKRVRKKGGSALETIGNIANGILDVAKTVGPFIPLIAAGKPKAKSKARAKGGAKLGLLDLPLQRGQPELTPAMLAKVTVKSSPEIEQTKVVPKNDMPSKIGGAVRKPNARALLVKKIMAEQKLSLPMASKYIKEHNLYKK